MKGRESEVESSLMSWEDRVRWSNQTAHWNSTVSKSLLPSLHPDTQSKETLHSVQSLNYIGARVCALRVLNFPHSFIHSFSKYLFSEYPSRWEALLPMPRSSYCWRRQRGRAILWPWYWLQTLFPCNLLSPPQKAFKKHWGNWDHESRKAGFVWLFCCCLCFSWPTHLYSIPHPAFFGAGGMGVEREREFPRWRLADAAEGPLGCS